ncbi:MAG: hypothetical protein FWG74_00565 [Planctomycetes bacterium]|nr:hypothetical protein [Planctomycetota bacterium]
MLVNNFTANIAAYTHAASLQTASAGLSVSGSYLEITGGMSALSSLKADDQLDVSEQARELVKRIRELDVFKIIYPDSDVRRKTKSLEEVEADFMADFTGFAGAFGKLSSLMGLGSSDMFTMGLDGVGGMTVTGVNKTLAANLQQAFSNDNTLVSRFAVMAARAALVDAGNTLSGFKNSYAEDPITAIKDNIDALKERLLGFRTQAAGGIMNYGFVREFSLSVEYSVTSAAYSVTEAA